MATDETVLKAAFIQAATQVILQKAPGNMDPRNLAGATVNLAFAMWRQWDAGDKSVTQAATDATV